MLDNNITTNFFNLQELFTDKVKKTNNSLKFYYETQPSLQICPCCGNKTKYSRLQNSKSKRSFGF